ncbi:MAG: response regulator [Eubacteriales bacterium]|nr:response regulator [Eubacteriales bacterium]
MKKKRTVAIAIAVTLNVTLILCVLFSVISAFNNAETVSFFQNIENVRTLTDATASKVELQYLHQTRDIQAAASYVNGYQGAGMTEEELRAFFAAYYEGDDDVYAWQLADSQTNDAAGSLRGVDAISLSDRSAAPFSYKTQIYPELTRIFVSASADTLGEVRYTSEFTDASPSLQKVSAITTPVRVCAGEGYGYKTLLLLVRSGYINDLIDDNNNIDTLNFFDYSNIIIDDEGDYVFSNTRFQGTNIADYMALYNDDFTEEAKQSLLEGLHQEDYTDALYYKNNRGQDCVFTIVPVQNSAWHILSIVPLNSFHNAYDFNENFLSFAVWFGALFLVDIVFVLIINRQLRRRTREAEAASIAKSEFLSSMSHDIRTPMNAIIGMTVIADETLKEKQPDAETLKDCVKTIQLSGNHLLTLINDILDISKIENGRVTLAPDDFSISESIGKMLEIVQPQIKEKRFVFETHIMNVTHEFVHADELRINQIYINILSNAIKYTGPGGRITVDLMEEPLPDRTDAARFVYRVSDTGIGMSPEFLQNIFERFSRAVDTRVNTTQGTGLGMSICKQLVDLMGGTIEVKSALNEGSTFTVSLELPVADVRAENVSLDGMRALLIDDDPILLETAELALKKAGMRVDAAQKGEDGVDMAVEHALSAPYDVILVDWKMAGMDGLHVVRQLRARLGDGIKIVVMTAYSIADVEHEARQAGVDGFLTKPLFRSKLLHAIQALFTDQADAPAAPEKRSFDLTVLVAEDNDTNWKVLGRLLDHYGVRSERAVNGREAVNAVAGGGRYDLVLMDIQMPIMNGYEATRAIRQLADTDRASVPIYAMTADTFAEDVAKCLASGMNGHLAKPVEVDKLLKVLSQIGRQS